MSSSSTPSVGSVSSNSSIVSVSSTGNTLDQLACDILNLMCNERDFNTASQFIHPAVTIQHDEDPLQTSRDELFARWKGVAARNPHVHLKIHEAVVDEGQRKVWVRGEMRGLPEGYKEKIYMMSFDEQGMLVRSDDYYRKRKSV